MTLQEWAEANSCDNVTEFAVWCACNNAQDTLEARTHESKLNVALMGWESAAEYISSEAEVDTDSVFSALSYDQFEKGCRAWHFQI